MEGSGATGNDAASETSSVDSSAPMEESRRGTKDRIHDVQHVGGRPTDDRCGGIVISRHFPKLLHRVLSGSKGGRNSDPGDGSDGLAALDARAEDDDRGAGRAVHAIGNAERDCDVVSRAMEWLPHGQGWRVLRWDVMCTHVLPNEFSELCEDVVGDVVRGKDQVDDALGVHDGCIRDASEGGVDIQSGNMGHGRAMDDKRKKADEEEDDGGKRSRHKKTRVRAKDERGNVTFSDDQWIEAFLWHVKAWGFQQVKSGRDKGSFRHQVREPFPSIFF